MKRKMEAMLQVSDDITGCELMQIFEALVDRARGRSSSSSSSTGR